MLFNESHIAYPCYKQFGYLETVTKWYNHDMGTISTVVSALCHLNWEITQVIGPLFGFAQSGWTPLASPNVPHEQWP